MNPSHEARMAWAANYDSDPNNMLYDAIRANNQTEVDRLLNVYHVLDVNANEGLFIRVAQKYVGSDMVDLLIYHPTQTFDSYLLDHLNNFI